MKRLLQKIQSQKGFTLVEIVFVLAIAGLIFALVFIGISQAQAARRDSQRKQDVGRLIAAINQYGGNNNGNVPPNNSFVSQYLPTNFEDPNTGTYIVDVTPAAPSLGHISYQPGGLCSGSGGTRDYAVRGFQERGGSFCVDSR